MSSFIARFGGADGMTGLASINRALAAGMSIDQIRNQLRQEGVGTGPKAAAALAPAPTPTPAPSYASNFDQSILARQLKAHGRAGGSISMEGFQEFLDLGHGAGALEDAVKSAQGHGLKIGQSLSEYFKTGINPIQRQQEQAAADARAAEIVAATQAQSQATREQTESMLQAADERLAAMANQSKMEQAAADQRAQAEAEARRMQMIRDRGAGRSSNLQIGAPTVDKKAGGSANFRRRADQFRITPKFKGLSPIIQNAAQVASNSMVNI
tara:strand:- start:430 stop:1236 length:807 start_codon:yes stop_codon:yes gene_type:complete